MLIERTYVNTQGVKKLVDYLSYKEATAKSKAKQIDIIALSDEVNEGWWEKNRC